LVVDRGGVVHQQVQRTRVALDASEQGFDLCVVAVVDGHRDAPVAGIGDGAPRDVDLPAAPQQRGRDAEPGTTAGAGDHGDGRVGHVTREATSLGKP
jgi:hypothetical protein